MIIKRILVTFLAAILAISVIALTGCGDEKSNVIDIDKLGSIEVETKNPATESEQEISDEPTKPPYLDPEGGMSDEEIKEELDDLLQPVDADAYFAERGTVKEKIPMSKATGLKTEAEAYKILKDRGFIIGENCTCEVSYDLQGNYFDERVITETSDEKHPDYTIQFQDAKDRIWIIYFTNGEWDAYLFSEALKNNNLIFVSEKDTLMGYDSATNTFYKYIPNDDYGKLTTVNIIDAKTLGEFES